MSFVLERPGIYLWFNLTSMPFMYRTPCVNKCIKYSCYVLTKQFLCNLWWTFCAIYIVRSWFPVESKAVDCSHLVCVQWFSYCVMRCTSA